MEGYCFIASYIIKATVVIGCTESIDTESKYIGFLQNDNHDESKQSQHQHYGQEAGEFIEHCPPQDHYQPCLHPLESALNLLVLLVHLVQLLYLAVELQLDVS